MKHLAWFARAFAVVGLAASSPSPAAGNQLGPRAATAVDAIDGILEAFDRVAVVALGEGGHGGLRGHAFRLSLIRDPRFAATVNDIVVESGNARFQDVMDRFINGADVPHDVLRRVWEDTTATAPAFELPVYEEFFRAVRTVNASMPPERRLRVLLGDPPIDWAATRTLQDYLPWNYQRDSHAADVIRREVLAKGRRALVVYGDGHIWRKDLGRGIVTLLESTGTKVFAISGVGVGGLMPVPPETSSWRVPALVRLAGTTLGRKPFTEVYASGMSGPHNPYEGVSMQDQFDATLYLGPGSSPRAAFPQELCRDRAYVAERLRRLSLGRPVPVERLRDCP